MLMVLIKKANGRTTSNTDPAKNTGAMEPPSRALIRREKSTEKAR